jgi:hypothetical protein
VHVRQTCQDENCGTYKLVHEPETLVAFVRHLLIQGVRPAVPVLLGTGAVPVLVELPLEDAAFTARAATDTRARRLKLASILRRGMRLVKGSNKERVEKGTLLSRELAYWQ